MMAAINNIETRNREYSDILNETLGLRTKPIAVKLIDDETKVPGNAIRFLRDYNKHLALCQAFALVRRESAGIYCDKTSEWCWAPLVGLGLCECGDDTAAFNVLTGIGGNPPNEAAKKFISNLPRLPLGKYTGILLAPLDKCDYEPDVTLIYCDNNSQLRGAVLAIKTATGKLVETQLDAIDSCVYSCVGTINSGEYRVTIPDIGEHERAFAAESEIILSVPVGKLEELTSALSTMHKHGMGYANWKRGMTYDFPRPPFYEEVFRIWGLD
jgi:uncharacterized protein (DUF169 family)